MPNKQSTVAMHPQRAEIDRQLRAGVSSMKVARDHDLSRQAMDRYKSKLMAKPAGQTDDDDRAAMRRDIQGLYNSVVALMRSAKDENSPRKFLAATAEARRCLNLLSKILGVLDATPPPVAVTVNVDIAELQQVILVALTPFPEARQACAAALIEHHDRESRGEQ